MEQTEGAPQPPTKGTLQDRSDDLLRAGRACRERERERLGHHGRTTNAVAVGLTHKPPTHVLYCTIAVGVGQWFILLHTLQS